ncbi:unnamed protein product [Phytophthora fragariaefolia]|uniref:Unnamed protein product n=1 Tax=Phytophthora fragariaefolia TaxID=1490495 RepID=A0A9W6WW78_9STRA|nr:unnamed protein product [Phytophthora fragariaefolia]
MLSAAKAAEADLVKQRLIDIVLANLRYDVKLQLISPKAKLQRIYPAEHPPQSLEAAVVMLFAHYTKMRQVSVLTPAPQTFWEGPTVLRATAVYLREPVYVWDIGTNEDAYVQQYSYRTFTMDNGDSHETGVVHALSEDRIRDIREACFHLHVIPTKLLLKHKVSHFYGVHHRETFHEWHGQRGPEMRARLDTVHAQVGFPILPTAGYEPESVETIERICGDDESDDTSHSYCEGWLATCHTASTQEALELARDRQRWSDLGQLVDVSLLRLRPLEIPLEHWFILHVIPYVISGWTDTAMGRAPTSSRAIWYNEYQQVQDLCMALADSSDWSHALRLHLGPLRAEQDVTPAQAGTGIPPPHEEDKGGTPAPPSSWERGNPNLGNTFRFRDYLTDKPRSAGNSAATGAAATVNRMKAVTLAQRDKTSGGNTYELMT